MVTSRTAHCTTHLPALCTVLHFCSTCVCFTFSNTNVLQDVIEEIGEIPASRVTAYPKKKISISHCSEKYLDRKWTMSDEQLYSNLDIKN